MICTPVAQEGLKADPGGDGQLEFIVQTFNHGLDIFMVPDSECNILLKITVRGSPLRMGQPSRKN